MSSTSLRLVVCALAMATCVNCESPGSDSRPLGRFADLTAPIESAPPFTIGTFETGPESINALLADLDEDGRAEVIVSPTEYRSGASQAHPTVYTFDPIRRELVSRGQLFGNDDPPILAIIDLDGDGHVDTIDRSNTIRWGAGAGRFEPVPTLLGQADRALIGTSAIAFDDIDDDGWLDIVASGADHCESCRDVIPVIATGRRRFASRPDLMTPLRMVGSYAVISARTGPGERTLVALGPAGPPGSGVSGFYRATSRSSDGYPRFEPFDPTPASSHWHSIDAIEGRPSLSAVSPMGAAVGDFDGDGVFDMAITTDPQHALLRGRREWPFEDVTGASGIAETPGERSSMIPWGVSGFDYTGDGRPDLLVAHGNDFGAFMDNRVGSQSLELYANRSGFHFERVASDIGIGRRGQWKSLVVSDLDGDGDPDVTVGGQGEWPRIYLNELLSPSASFGVRLRGTTSNVLGVGSIVEVHSDGLPSQRLPMVLGGGPWVTSDAIVFASTGPTHNAETVIVHWASGMDQRIGPLAAGTVHTITEPEWLAIRPASRHVPADGHSLASMRIEIAPRFPLDDQFFTRNVTVDIVSGAGTVAPLARDGDVWTTAITAPTTPGSSVIEVRVNNVPARIHPRIFWDPPA